MSAFEEPQVYDDRLIRARMIGVMALAVALVAAVVAFLPVEIPVGQAESLASVWQVVRSAAPVVLFAAWAGALWSMLSWSRARVAKRRYEDAWDRAIEEGRVRM